MWQYNIGQEIRQDDCLFRNETMMIKMIAFLEMR